jgi:rubrerythrin
MSIIRSLLRFIDSVEHRKTAEEERRKREALPPDVDPDQIELTVPPRRDEAQPMVCRVCGHEGEGEFCPTCLAGTMRPRR